MICSSLKRLPFIVRLLFQATDSTSFRPSFRGAGHKHELLSLEEKTKMAFPTTYLPSIKKKLLCIIDQIEQHDYDFNATPTNGIKPWLKELSHLAAAGTDLQVEACLRSIAFHAAMIATPVNNTDEELGTAPTEPPIASTHKALD